MTTPDQIVTIQPPSTIGGWGLDFRPFLKGGAELQQILQLADTCVKCGLCLPHCPTYSKTAQEADSPRGRIAIIQGLLTGQLADTPRVAECLDRCLECHACEAACPSGTPVTRIIDATRAVRTERRHDWQRWLRLRLLDLAVRPAWLMPWVRRYQTSSFRPWLQKSGWLRRIGLDHAEHLLPERPLIEIAAGIAYSSPPKSSLLTRAGENPAAGIAESQIGIKQLPAAILSNAVIDQSARLAIFPGCLGRFLDAQALEAAIKILTRCGYPVTIPSQSCCCGALHRHDGFAVRADMELAQTAELLSEYTRVLTLASACFGELHQAQGLAGRVEDAVAYIAALPWPADLAIDATVQTVWVHVPCTQRHPIGDPTATMRLLARIPGITPRELPNNDVCCGAAGTYMLRQPKLSQALLADKLQLINTAAATVVATTNTGCALRLAAGLRTDKAQSVRVCHPLEILAERLA